MTTAGGTSVGANRTTPAAAAATTMATARHQNSSSSSSSSSDQIEAKMHTALATVRKDRDTARRNYELAMERLTLLRTEVQTAERTVQERHTTLTQLQHDKQSLEGQITPLRQAVIQLKQEVCTLCRWIDSFFRDTFSHTHPTGYGTLFLVLYRRNTNMPKS